MDVPWLAKSDHEQVKTLNLHWCKIIKIKAGTKNKDLTKLN